jgi:hypothetical protein
MNRAGCDEVRNVRRTEAEIKSFIDSVWRQLAMMAWQEYLNRGRGAIVLDVTAAEQLELGIFKCQATYFALESEVPEELQGFSIDETILKLNSYDPAREILIIVISSADSLNSFAVTGAPDPIECYLSQYPSARPKDPASVIFN